MFPYDLKKSTNICDTYVHGMCKFVTFLCLWIWYKSIKIKEVNPIETIVVLLKKKKKRIHCVESYFIF